MISAWWLLLIIPAASAAGIFITGLCAINSQQDRCANCQHNCINCSKNKEKSE